jgi:hypothetical protein
VVFVSLIATAAIAALVALTLALQGPLLAPPTPSLLRGLEAGGGSWWRGECPEDKIVDHRPEFEMKAPEFDRRLLNGHPPGPTASSLEHELILDGFVLIGPCRDERAIQRAVFRQGGGGMLNFPAFAEVNWRVDGRGRIIWAAGTIAYTGP